MPRRKKGLGDTVEAVLQATGIDKVAKFILGEDCGCEERKAKLNELFPYNQPKCLTEQEYNYITSWFDKQTVHLTPVEQIEMLKIYNRVFNTKHGMTSCVGCWRDFMKNLKKIHDEYATA